MREGRDIRKPDVVALIEKEGFIPAIRATNSDSAYPIVREVTVAGVAVVELTATTKDWPRLLQTLVAKYPDVSFGMGTITTAEDAESAAAAGAEFLVSPYPAESARAAAAAGISFIGSGATPGEIAGGDVAQRVTALRAEIARKQS